MSTQDRIYGVLLTDKAWNDLSEALARYASTGPTGKYIYCRDINPDGNYFVMVASCTNSDRSSFEAEISIPHHFVTVRGAVAPIHFWSPRANRKWAATSAGF